MAKNVLLTGGTGFVGKQLTDLLIDNGFTVSILSRTARENTSLITYYKWNLKVIISTKKRFFRLIISFI
ncbi:NAD-dependent epimerase/dehydratase family protein [Flavobacterium sp. N502536]|uniref:NAD-dependent epimerase/dehydratase family protein n=1 Tax=Flavobacterium sp. N502536 TaxID=2986837 RepID=UPI0022212B15|nr:NAD-dependent epimerase/dehydratase family protein [Flavobacterium sp. N502536]